MEGAVEGLLRGVRVIDFGRYIAGPFCACLLGDLGADVIRVERVDGGEDRFVAPVGADGVGALFLQVNRNKRGLTLDPMTPDGKEVVRRLVASADVVVANLPGSTLAAMGLDYETVRAVRPDVVLTTVDAFGSSGPYRERVGFDGVAQLMSGAAYLSGEPGRPTKSYVPWVDYTTASLSALATMAALLWRRETGRGQHVEGALLKSALAVASTTLIEQATIDADRTAIGNRSHHASPSDVFATSDGWVIVQVIGKPLFERWAKLVGADDWISDPRFASDQSRAEHAGVLGERMARWCEGRTTAEALGELEAARVPAGPLYTPQQVLDDPHVKAIGYLKPTPYPGVSRDVPLVGTPFALSETPGSIRRRAPKLGEHSDEILAELGFGPSDIARLREQRTI